MDSSTDYLRVFYELAGEQGLAQGLTIADFARAKSREELGIGSLNVILIIASYLKRRAGDGLAFSPAWVSRMDDTNGIVSVMREIDERCRERATVE